MEFFFCGAIILNNAFTEPLPPAIPTVHSHFERIINALNPYDCGFVYCLQIFSGLESYYTFITESNKIEYTHLWDTIASSVGLLQLSLFITPILLCALSPCIMGYNNHHLLQGLYYLIRSIRGLARGISKALVGSSAKYDTGLWMGVPLVAVTPPLSWNG